LKLDERTVFRAFVRDQPNPDRVEPDCEWIGHVGAERQGQAAKQLIYRGRAEGWLMVPSLEPGSTLM
jgi:hypothetical protein